MAHRIWLDEHFWTVNFELAAAAGLRAAGLDVVYEKKWEGVTPDWTVLSESGKPSAFVEVHTDSPPKETFAQMRAWHGLVERIKKIPVPVVLQLARAPDSSTPPDAGYGKEDRTGSSYPDRPAPGNLRGPQQRLHLPGSW